MTNENALTVSLEEFGLSIYEARAYVTLITRGTMSASDLAFYSGIPRTKIYTTMKKLTSKKLATSSNSKSVMTCSAVQPEDAFDSVIDEQIQKVTAMNALVAELKKAGEENRRSNDSEEKRYVQMGPGSTLAQMRGMIDGTRDTIMIMFDRWGLGLLAECRDQLLAAVQKRDVAVRCLIPPDQICEDSFRALPGSVESRVTGSVGNCVIFDKTEVMILDNANGRGAVFSSAEMLGASQVAVFEGLWSGAMPIDAFADMTVAEAHRIFGIIDVIDKAGLPYVLGGIARTDARDGSGGSGFNNCPDLYELLERDGIILDRMDTDEVVGIFDVIMQITCSGSTRMETGGRSISVESPRNGGSSLPWVAVLDGYLRRRGYNTRVVCQSGGASGGERTHIHMDKN